MLRGRALGDDRERERVFLDYVEYLAAKERKRQEKEERAREREKGGKDKTKEERKDKRRSKEVRCRSYVECSTEQYGTVQYSTEQ